MSERSQPSSLLKRQSDGSEVGAARGSEGAHLVLPPGDGVAFPTTRAANACPRCGHPLNLHNDAGTIQQGDTGMCCYFNDTGRQFRADRSPERCGCTYDGPGTERF